MQQQQGLQTFRTLKNKDNIEVQNDMSGEISTNSLSKNKSSLSSGDLSQQQKTKSSHGHNHGKGENRNQGQDHCCEDHSHSHEEDQDSHGNEGHDHSKKNSSKKKGKQPIKYWIMFFIVLSIFGCLYLVVYHFNPLIGGYLSRLLDYQAYFLTIMILWSYIQTHRIKNRVPKLSRFMSHDTIGTQLVDPNYLLTARVCDRCNYFKLPRVSHCSTCGECIYKLDHHCIWTQTCIGHCNQRSFILFCFYMTVGITQFLICTVRTVNFILAQQESSFLDFFTPAVYVLWLISCVSALVLGYMVFKLLFDHCLIICTNATTLDAIKRKVPAPLPFIQYKPFYHLNDRLINTFDRGQIQNLRSLFGTNILTFWLPLKRQIENEFIIEPMNPQPTKLQLIKQTHLFDAEIDINKQWYNVCMKAKQLYKSKKLILDGEEIVI